MRVKSRPTLLKLAINCICLICKVVLVDLLIVNFPSICSLKFKFNHNNNRKRSRRAEAIYSMVLHIWDHMFVWPIPMWLLVAFMWTTECKKCLVLTFNMLSPFQKTNHDDGLGDGDPYHSSNDTPWNITWKWIKIIDIKCKGLPREKRNRKGKTLH